MWHLESVVVHFFVCDDTETFAIREPKFSRDIRCIVHLFLYGKPSSQRSSKEEGKTIYEESMQIMTRDSMNPRKWNANSENLSTTLRS